jgi:threonine efflux protein
LQLDYALLLSFTLLWLAIVPTPGPNSLLIVHLALTAGWRDVAVALAGNLLAIAFYALATLLGLALLLGGVYLMWAGARLVRSGLAWRRADEAGAARTGPRQERGTSAFLQGVVTQLANVQALFFLASIFAAVGLLAANTATQIAAVGIILLANGAYLALLAWLMQRERPRAFYARNRDLMKIGFGLMFVVFGLRLVLREAVAWL